LVSNDAFEGVKVEWIPGATPTAHFYDEDGFEINSATMGNLNQEEIEEFFIRHGFPLRRAGKSYDEELATIVEWDGHTYELHPQVNSLAYAQEFILSRKLDGRNGYLAVISSQEEQKFIESLLGESVQTIWLGGSDAEIEGVWKWQGGENAGQIFYGNAEDENPTSVYVNWAPGEPNDVGNEDCLTFIHGKGWNDVNCLVEQSSLLLEYDFGSSPFPETVGKEEL